MLNKDGIIGLALPDKIASTIDLPKRYKIYYGGRAATKSWGIAQYLVSIGALVPVRILCTREIQKSIQESVHKLLSDQIHAMNLSHLYEIQKTTILGHNGTEFLFAGLRHNINNLKSYESVDITWVEEAQTVSNASWSILIPTIRKPGSQIIISFNPDLEDDPTYQRFVVDPPTDSVVTYITYEDNKWLSDEIRQEIEDCKRRSLADYQHVWLGRCKQAIEGAIFAEELRKANEEHRITRVPVAEGIPVNTYWDLGQSDNTAIWFVQLVGMEYRIVDYYQASGHKMPHYIGVIAGLNYHYGDHYLPHDADYEQMAAQSTIKEQLEQALRDNPKLGNQVHIVERTPKKAIGINAARSIFERCLFDKEKTADGLQCLRRYRYALDVETGKIGKEPAHDIYSHGADAFLQLAQHAKPPVKQAPINYPRLGTI